MRALDDPTTNAGNVIIGRDIAVGVLDFDPPSITTIPPSLDAGAITRGIDRGSDGRRPIDPRMHARIMQNGMKAHPEWRGDLAVGDRLSPQGLSAPGTVV